MSLVSETAHRKTLAVSGVSVLLESSGVEGRCFIQTKQGARPLAGSSARGPVYFQRSVSLIASDGQLTARVIISGRPDRDGPADARPFSTVGRARLSRQPR